MAIGGIIRLALVAPLARRRKVRPPAPYYAYYAYYGQ